jgi:tRNA(Arg) A34 adenosine deaminase TadA
MNAHSLNAITTRCLDVIEHDILPLTKAGVAQGNKVFGAAIIRKSDLSLVLAETNNEMENPLWHGEMHALKRYYELPATQRTALSDCHFISTHEPCSLCLSAITWAGLDNFHYFFSHEDSRDSFAIPHDLKILREVFGLGPDGYAKSNAFWQCRHIISDAVDLKVEDAPAQIERIQAAYAALSRQYQDGKADNNIPLA